MNILHTETLYNWGGQQNKVINEMHSAQELGHNVMLFCNPNSEILKRARKENFKVIACEMNKKNFHKTVPILCKILWQENIDVVISNGSTDSWVAAISKIFTRKKGVKFIRERHNEFPIRGFLSKFLHTTLFDKIISVSPNVTKVLQKIGVKDEKIFFIPTFVDYDALNAVRSTFKEEFNIPKEAITVGMFSSLSRQKGVFEFANALKILMQENSDIYGIFGGNINKNTKDQILSIFDEAMREKLLFTDFRSDIANVVKGIDYYAFPSHTEGLPTALLEAMVLSRPIVAFDIAPMNKLLAENRGQCAKFLDAQDMAENINAYIQNDELAKQCAENASTFVKENYDTQILKTYIKRLLESL
ncbi:glycosyltransferase family 4 protein [Campylobacter concisus]|uniref:glycosyltransferase family 4 protein n=1 Tax=Campylobacter concisus TaxID=199 RepID=UPI000CD8F439|nr:glycosyltransferase family 4 protein [Campylobacter concisus]